MSRLPSLHRDDLDDEGRDLYDLLLGSRRAKEGHQGPLPGPYNAWVYAPKIGRQLETLRVLLRNDMTLDRSLIELAIIVTGAYYRAEFEWWVHSAMARKNGVSPDIVDAIARDEPPPLVTNEQRAVYSVARQLAERGRVDDTAYSLARSVLGDRRMVELVTLCGYYALVSITLNAFEVELPDGVAPQWNAP